MKKKLLIFHPTIAPYRIDFFNSLYGAFETRVCLTFGRENTFDYDAIYNQLLFKPYFLATGFCRQIDEFNPDIVIVSEFGKITIEVLLYRWLKQSKYKVISICDDSYNMLADRNDFSRIHRLARKLAVPSLDDLILVEPLSRDWYQATFRMGYYFPIIRDDNKQRAIYEKILPVSQSIMESYGLADKNIFLFVGRFVALKNIPRIIEAFSRLNQQENALVLIGSGVEETNVKQAAEMYHVKPIFTGRLEGENLYAWYNVADYFILASWQEAFGAVTNEALLAGCYSLVSKRAGSHCLIEEGVNGFTFDPMNVDELHRKMVEVVDKFPKKIPMDKVKDNLMPLKYDAAVSGLISHLNHL